MKRDVMPKLIEWARRKERMPLLITGIRQCGKTYAMRELGETEFFGNYVYFNFEKNPELADLFEQNIVPERILEDLQIISGKVIVPGKTLVIFDEIQSCTKAITSLKYFCEDIPKLHLVCAGSLLGVTLKKEKLSFPVGKVERIKMYPMTFHEFLQAQNDKALALLENSFEVGKEIRQGISDDLTRSLKLYYIVGGMPKAVETWIETKDINRVEMVQDSILKDYESDFSKHAPKVDIPKLGWIWDSIPVQLAKDNNKFVFSHVKAGKRSADLEDALMWIEAAGLAYRLKQVEEIGLPLSNYASSTKFKFYMADVGLLRKKAGLSAEAIVKGDEKYVEFKGALTENYVMQQLVALGKEPYYWRSNNSAELDFIFEENTNIIPVEVKAETNTKAKSLTTYCSRYKPDFALITSLKNVGEHKAAQTTVYSIPLYMLWKMDKWLEVENEKKGTFDLAKYMESSFPDNH